MAAIRQQRLADAQAQLDALRPLAADPAVDALLVWDRYPLSHAARIAERTVTAELAAARGRHEEAVAALILAVTIEDRIPYDEPPGWHAPVRQTLGAVLLQSGRAAEAEAVYREELRRNSGNGWSLYGLARSLQAQGKPDAGQAMHSFRASWAQSGPPLASSRM